MCSGLNLLPNRSPNVCATITVEKSPVTVTIPAALIFFHLDNSCTVCRVNFIQCHSNTDTPGRRGLRKEKFAPAPEQF